MPTGVSTGACSVVESDGQSHIFSQMDGRSYDCCIAIITMAKGAANDVARSCSEECRTNRLARKLLVSFLFHFSLNYANMKKTCRQFVPPLGYIVLLETNSDLNRCDSLVSGEIYRLAGMGVVASVPVFAKCATSSA